MPEDSPEIVQGNFPDGEISFRAAETDAYLGRKGLEDTGRLFKRLIARLGRSYDITKASLTLHGGEADGLRITHILKEGVSRSGLALGIPKQDSLLYEVLRQGYPLVDNYPELASGNPIERKILLTARTASVAVIPIIHDGLRLGVVSLASDQQSAFSPYLNGLGTEDVDEFAASLVNIFACQADIK
jgi:hypothetical protein